MTGDSVPSFLREVPLFAGLDNEPIARLAAGSRTQHIAKGDFLFYQGDPAYSIYVVRRGWIVILLAAADGRELVLTEMRPGDVFGENAVITGAPRSASAVAREDTELCEIMADAFLGVLDSCPLLARQLLRTAAARLAAGNEREAALAFLQAGARVARVLHTLDDLDRSTADKGYVTVSQDELAQRTGLTRQTVARFLGNWRRNGWLLTGRGRIMLLNREAIFAVEEETLG